MLNAHTACVQMLIERGASAEQVQEAVRELRHAVANSFVGIQHTAMNDRSERKAAWLRNQQRLRERAVALGFREFGHGDLR